MDRINTICVVAALFGVTLSLAGLTMAVNRKTEPQILLVAPPVETINEWDVLRLAIIKTESNFDSTAVGSHNDIGLMQITPIYVDEVNRLLGEKRFTHSDAFDTDKALEMFELMQMFKNPEHDIDKAISLHNKSKAYAMRVKSNMEYVRTYEQIKNKL